MEGVVILNCCHAELHTYSITGSPFYYLGLGLLLVVCVLFLIVRVILFIVRKTSEPTPMPPSAGAAPGWAACPTCRGRGWIPQDPRSPPSA